MTIQFLTMPQLPNLPDRETLRKWLQTLNSNLKLIEDRLGVKMPQADVSIVDWADNALEKAMAEADRAIAKALDRLCAHTGIFLPKPQDPVQASRIFGMLREKIEQR